MAAIPLDLLDRIRELERQVRELAGRAQMRPALDKILHGDIVIGEGGQLIARAPNGNATFSVGQTPQGDWGIFLRRDDGTRAITIGDDVNDGDQMWRMWARDTGSPAGVLMMDDALCDRFLGRPVLPLQLHPTKRQDSDLAIYQSAWSGAAPATHAVAEIQLYTFASRGGQVKITMRPDGTDHPVTVAEYDVPADTWMYKRVVQPLHDVEYMQWVTWTVDHRNHEANQYIETRLYSALQRHTHTRDEVPRPPQRTPVAAPAAEAPAASAESVPEPPPAPGLRRVDE
ncbi:hypothetical protein ACFP1Z_09410 [Streptomyces gamaensis]|uniref:Uncharacterized protein n=1 Tax=Streptomyces gamaensis TaxID=1763542 RepID=A0ABW0Z006_9ACTN